MRIRISPGDRAQSRMARSEAGVYLPHVCKHDPDYGADHQGDSKHGERDPHLSPSFKGVASHAALVVAQVRSPWLVLSPVLRPSAVLPRRASEW